MVSGPPDADSRASVIFARGLPTKDDTVVFAPSSRAPHASRLRAAIAQHLNLSLPEGAEPGIYWFGDNEDRRLVLLPDFEDPAGYGDILERYMLAEQPGMGRGGYVALGALQDMEVSLHREALAVQDAISRYFGVTAPEMHPARITLGAAGVTDTKEIESLAELVDQAPPLPEADSPGVKSSADNIASDQRARDLMAREFGGRVPNKNGDVNFRFTEILAPTKEEIVFLTRASAEYEPVLVNAIETKTARVRSYDPTRAQLFSSRFEQTERDPVIFDLRAMGESDPNEHLKEIFMLLDADVQKIVPNLLSPGITRIFVPVHPKTSGVGFTEFGDVIGAAASANVLGAGPSERQIIFAFETPLSDFEHTRLRQNVRRAIEGLGGSYQPPSDPSLDDDTPLNEMPDQFHADHALTSPTQDDLGRDAIAQAVAENVRRVWEAQMDARRPFAIHLSGRWGSGKSSILTFLRHKLQNDDTFDNTTPGTIFKPKKKGWVVIDYNAWRMQEAGPPWWSLLTAVREQGYKALKAQGHWPRLKDWLWRNTRVAWPWLLTLALVALLVLAFAVFGADSFTFTKALKEADNPLAFVLASIAALVPLGALGKLIQGWSKSATETAEAVRDLQSDPTAVVKARFRQVIETIDRPVAVFIDDLDRCEAQFVVDLLQSLQTAYAQVPVLYVVASDRDWIVSAYNQVYKDFQPEISKPGAPLGYLFVKKIFQLSVPVPDLAPGDRTRLTEALLKTEAAPPVPTESRASRVQNIEAAAAKGDLSEVSRIQKVALSEGQNLAPEVMKAVTEPENQMQLRHQLLHYTALFDGNPRFIKRLINALTFRQGYILSAAEDIAFDVIARWTILSLTHPYSADLLAETPARIDEVFAGPPGEGETEFPNRADAALILDGLHKEDIEQIAAFG